MISLYAFSQIHKRIAKDHEQALWQVRAGNDMIGARSQDTAVNQANSKSEMNMRQWSLRSALLIDKALALLGYLLILAGIWSGWIAPHLSASLPLSDSLQTTLTHNNIDSVAVLGADLTTLAVLVAVLIGYNVAGLQIAGQMLSLAFMRAILMSLGPFLLWWLMATGVALVYLLVPPLYYGQLWQILFWFGAVAFFMIGYLWSLPWRLSAGFATQWALKDLRGKAIDTWEVADGYITLQTGIVGAITRSDISAMRTMTIMLGTFLSQVRDRAAEKEKGYRRGRWRALKNLLSSSAYTVPSAPNSVTYYLGFLTSGILLQAVAAGLVGQPSTPHDADLYSGLLRPIRELPEKIDALWAGIRHSMCRKGLQGEPYLIQYWQNHQAWGIQDERMAEGIAEGLALLYRNCWRDLRSTLSPIEADTRAFEILDDCYRYLTTYLVAEIQQKAFSDLPFRLLKALHTKIGDFWLSDAQIPFDRVTSIYLKYSDSKPQ
jgi:hypothetical protein